MNKDKDILLWDGEEFTIHTPLNPHIPYSEGLHLVLSSKRPLPNAWVDSDLAGRAFKLAAKSCQIAQHMSLAPWFNLQANGNWGLLPGSSPHFHIHVYGRNKTAMWGKPLVLPERHGTYNNAPMPQADQDILIKAFKDEL